MMINETVPTRPLAVAAFVGVAGAKSGAKQVASGHTFFYLVGRVLFLRAQSWFAPSQVIPSHVDGALTGFTSKEWNPTTEQRSVQLTHRYTSTHFRLDYPIGPVSLSGTSRPTLDELKDRMVLPIWGELRSSPSGP